MFDLRNGITLVVAVFVLIAVPVASGGAEKAAGSLALGSALSVTASSFDCPPGAPPEADFCPHRSGGGKVPGLGNVSQAYLYFVDSNPSPACGGVRILRSTGELTVSGRGTVQFVLGAIEQCVPDLLKSNQVFTITGGSGAYAGASGTGTDNPDLHEGDAGAVGTDTWTGSLDVPGHDFDVTAPTLSGLVTKTVRAGKGAKRARVKFRVTARDLVDGSVSVRWQPGSGSRFKVGRTVVRCSATDTSANTATGSFRVVVKRRR